MKRSQSLQHCSDDVKYEQYVNNLHDRLPQLNDPSDIDCKRWPWELLQNAKDTVVKRDNPEDRYVDVTIKYYTDEKGNKKLYFEHNGDQFTNKAIIGLIWKFSAEKRNEQTTEDGLTRDKQSTGRFGTGFMTTHALSLTVDVSGSLFHDDPSIMRNVSVDFTLHREGPDDDAYKRGVDMTEKEIDDNMDKREIPSGGILPTRFTYHLNREASEKAAEMGINNVRANAAQTMLFCPSVRSITVIDEVNSLDFKIVRKNKNEKKDIVKETTFIETSSDTEEPIIRRFISIEIEEYSKAISSHWKVKDRNHRIHVAVEVDKMNNILSIPSTTPSVYCSLPLIGFESMSLPFYINSNDFEPSTERTSLYLKKKRCENHSNEDTGEEEIYYLQSGINWSIFERSLSLYEKLVDYLVENDFNHRFNLINGLGLILKGAWNTETKNCLASRFILPLRQMLITKNLVKTILGYRSIDSGVKFVECAQNCDSHILYNLCESIYHSNLCIEEENQKWVSLKWTHFTFDSDFDEKKPDSENPSFPTVKYSQVADYIENAGSLDGLSLSSNFSTDVNEANKLTFTNTQKLEWLNKFYSWIKSSSIKDLSDRKIVPNRLGIFCSTEQGCKLKDASDIPTAIFDFMKRLGIDWDQNLLMEDVQHITLSKETKDNVVIAIKNKSKDIRERASESTCNKLTSLLPLLLALPSNNDARLEEFYQKRLKIVSIIKTMYKCLAVGVESVMLDLKAETWEGSDQWLMNIVATDLAGRKHLDVILEDDTEEEIANKFCTSTWLANTLDFMFDRSYLHQEDITFQDNKSNSLALIPNRYGNFKAINELYTQGQVPDELLAVELKKTGYDVNQELLYKGFDLNEKVLVTDLTVSKLAEKYNDFFEDTSSDDEAKLAVANYLIQLVPQCGDQYKETRNLYNTFINTQNKAALINIATSDLEVWNGANNFIIKYLCTKASELGSLEKIESVISKLNLDHRIDNQNKYESHALLWLNRLVTLQKNGHIIIDAGTKLVPDWIGSLHTSDDVTYDGSIISNYKNIDSLISLVNGDLWNWFSKVEGHGEYNNLVNKIVHPDFCFTKDFQDITDEKLFELVDKVIYYCSEHCTPEQKRLLKESIEILLAFFEKNEEPIIRYSQKDDAKLMRLFANTYKNRKNLSYDFIYDADTKARISKINENFTAEEIEDLIKERETVKNILSKKDYYENLEQENKHLSKQIEELSEFSSAIRNCSPKQLEAVKKFLFKLSNNDMPDVGGETPTGGDDKVVPKVKIVPEIYEFDVVDPSGNKQRVPADQVQYAGLSQEDIEIYVTEAKAAVVKRFRELDKKYNLGIEFNEKRIHLSSYSQLYGIRYKDAEDDIPLVVHSYKGPQYRYFDLNWYDWQLLNKPGSMLWILTINGLQCIPLYKLPLRSFKVNLDNSLSDDTRAALLTLGAIGNRYSRLSFDFGNNMPQGLKKRAFFNDVPEELKLCIDNIKQVCDKNIPQIASLYNRTPNIPIEYSPVGYSNALKEIKIAETMRDQYEAPQNDTVTPSVGTTYFD